MNTDKQYLAKLFPLPCVQEETRGVGDGIILKFKTFYLKIYDVDEGYRILSYRNGDRNPIFVDVVSVKDIKRYAQLFSREDGLRHLQRIRMTS